MSGVHTAGPWRSTGLEYEPESGWFIREDGDGRYLAVARVAATYRSTEEIEANARLIAAAPDLLDVLQFIVDGSEPNVLGMHTICISHQTVLDARAAILAATGASS